MTKTFRGLKYAHTAGILLPVKLAASAVLEARINGALYHDHRVVPPHV